MQRADWDGEGPQPPGKRLGELDIGKGVKEGVIGEQKGKRSHQGGVRKPFHIPADRWMTCMP